MAGCRMRYLAFLSDDPATLADFYARHFDLDELGRSNSGDVSLTDGFYNLTFLRRREALNEPHTETGLHHVGVQVDDMARAVAAYRGTTYGDVLIDEPGGIHFGDKRFYDPELAPVSVSEGGFGAPPARDVRPAHIAHVAFNALVPQRILVFYSNLFGFREVTNSINFRGRGRLNRFAGDGVTNLAIHPFFHDTEGHEGRFGVNHFGFLVDDIERRLEALAKEIHVAARPANRPFAEYRLQDPEGNKFDLSQTKGWEVDVDVWEADGERRVGRFETGGPGTRQEVGTAGH
ncbi:MAG: VOC family protein [Alphaproteobacteria bacterium]|nr:VOC family protein [Alphaproteobacteria bacterium]